MTLTLLQSIRQPFLDLMRPRVAPMSLHFYGLRMKVFFDWMTKHQVEEVTPKEVGQWMTDMVTIQNLSHRTIKFYVDLLEQLCDHAIDLKLAKVNPVQRKLLPRPRHKPSRPRTTFSPDDVRAILKDLLAHGDTDWHHLITVGTHTGLRLGDAACLRWSAINWENETICLTPAKTKRFGRTIQIPMMNELCLVLKARRENPDDRLDDMMDYVFPLMARSYQVSGPFLLSKRFFYKCKRAGVGNHGFHTLRHTFVSRLANNGVSYAMIKRMTGQSASIIEQYHHVSLEAQRKAIMS